MEKREGLSKIKKVFKLMNCRVDMADVKQSDRRSNYNQLQQQNSG